MTRIQVVLLAAALAAGGCRGKVVFDPGPASSGAGGASSSASTGQGGAGGAGECAGKPCGATCNCPGAGCPDPRTCNSVGECVTGDVACPATSSCFDTPCGSPCVVCNDVECLDGNCDTDQNCSLGIDACI